MQKNNNTAEQGKKCYATESNEEENTARHKSSAIYQEPSLNSATLYSNISDVSPMSGIIYAKKELSVNRERVQLENVPLTPKEKKDKPKESLTDQIHPAGTYTSFFMTCASFINSTVSIDSSLIVLTATI